MHRTASKRVNIVTTHVQADQSEIRNDSECTRKVKTYNVHGNVVRVNIAIYVVSKIFW